MSSEKVSREEELRTRYDRQVRLWGNETQQRLQGAVVHLSFSGTWGGAATELAKNLVLGGIGELSIDGPSKLDDAACGHSFFLLAAKQKIANGQMTALDAVIQGLQGLNPFVSVHAAPTTSFLQRISNDGSNVRERETTFVSIVSGFSGQELEKHYSDLHAATTKVGACGLLLSLNHFGPHALAFLIPLGIHESSSEVCRSAGKKSQRSDGDVVVPGGEGVGAAATAAAGGGGVVAQNPVQRLLGDGDFMAVQHPLFQACVVGVHCCNIQHGKSSDDLLTPIAVNARKTELGIAGELAVTAEALISSVKEGSAAVTCVECTAFGGILCQQLIAKLGGKTVGGSLNTSSQWFVLSMEDDVSCLVGSL